MWSRGPRRHQYHEDQNDSPHPQPNQKRPAHPALSSEGTVSCCLTSCMLWLLPQSDQRNCARPLLPAGDSSLRAHAQRLRVGRGVRCTGRGWGGVRDAEVKRAWEGGTDSPWDDREKRKRCGGKEAERERGNPRTERGARGETLMSLAPDRGPCPGWPQRERGAEAGGVPPAPAERSPRRKGWAVM